MCSYSVYVPEGLADDSLLAVGCTSYFLCNLAIGVQMDIILIILFIVACCELSKWLDILLGVIDLDISEIDISLVDMIRLIVSAIYFVWFLFHYVISYQI